MEPSVIKFWKGDRWHTTRTVFTTEEQVAEWYRRNRWRIDGLSIVVPVDQKDESSGVSARCEAGSSESQHMSTRCR
jgi:hypothetical protein